MSGEMAAPSSILLLPEILRVAEIMTSESGIALVSKVKMARSKARHWLVEMPLCAPARLFGLSATGETYVPVPARRVLHGSPEMYRSTVALPVGPPVPEL